MNDTLTALRGVSVGHATRTAMLTGVTVVLFDQALPVAVACHGGGPGTFNTDPFASSRGGASAHAIFVSGGSYPGLRSGAEIIGELIRRGIGFTTHAIVNPCVTGAVVLDLGCRIGRFDPAAAVDAVNAASASPVTRGNVGAGTGTAAGKFHYPGPHKLFAGMKAGVGCARVDLREGAFVVAMSVVNPLGNVVARDGTIMIGNRSDDGGRHFLSFLDVTEHMAEAANTTISVVGTNVALADPAAYQRVAQLAAHGQVRAINPVNLGPDGDTVFVFSTEEITNLVPPYAGESLRGTSWPRLDTDLVGQAAAEAVQESIHDACRAATSIALAAALNGTVPAYDNRFKQPHRPPATSSPPDANAAPTS